MNVLTNLLTLMGDNFLATGLIPSLTFLVAILVTFDPIIKASAIIQSPDSSDKFLLIGTLLLIPIIILSYALTGLNTYILKIYSGYTFLSHLPFLRNAQVRKASALMLRRNKLKQQIRIIQDAQSTLQPDDGKFEKLMDEYYVVASAYDHSYPQSIEGILPTTFGNILKASEEYAGIRYGFDGVAFWPLLIAVIPADYEKKIDATRSELAFLVNMSLLSIVFFLICIFTSFLNGIHLQGGVIQFVWDSLIWQYVGAGIVALLLHTFIYKAALYSVGSFGVLIRSAFDLYRLDLLKQFQLPLPGDSIEEFSTWKNLNELIVLGAESLTFMKLDYYREIANGSVLGKKEQKKKTY